MFAQSHRYLATSESRLARAIRKIYKAIRNISVPAPKLIVRPILTVVLFVRSVYYFLVRVFFCEPLFKAYCKSYGRNLHTGVFLHWVQGRGDLIIGDNVIIDGACNFFFAARYTQNPTLVIGDHTGIGHSCSFVVGNRITIGKHCRLAAGIQIFDVSGHPVDPADRMAGKPANQEDVRPVTIGDNVWIGSNVIIHSGVSIGDNSIVSTGSIVMSSVAANTIVAGNPARQIRVIPSSQPATPTT